MKLADAVEAEYPDDIGVVAMLRALAPLPAASSSGNGRAEAPRCRWAASSHTWHDAPWTVASRRVDYPPPGMGSVSRRRAGVTARRQG